MVDGLLVIAWVWVVWYKWGKLVGKYRRIITLSAELEKRWVKFTKEAIIDIRKLRSGQIFWLERWDDKRWYYHIFIQKREWGLTRYEQMVLWWVVSSKQELIDLIFKIIDKGKKEVVTLSSWRLWWVFSMNVKWKKVIVATWTNGFIVTVSIVKK